MRFCLKALKYAFSTSIEPGVSVKNSSNIRRRRFHSLFAVRRANEVDRLEWICTQVVKPLDSHAITDVMQSPCDQGHLKPGLSLAALALRLKRKVAGLFRECGRVATRGYWPPAVDPHQCTANERPGNGEPADRPTRSTTVAGRVAEADRAFNHLAGRRVGERITSGTPISSSLTLEEWPKMP